MESEPSSRSVGPAATQPTPDAYRQWQADRAQWQAAGGWDTGRVPPPLTHYIVSAALKHLGRESHAPTLIQDGDIEAVEAANGIDVGSHRMIRIGGHVGGLRLNAYKQWQADRARWQADGGWDTGRVPPPLNPDVVSAALKHLGRKHRYPHGIRDGDVEAVEAANDIDVGSHRIIRKGNNVGGLRLNAYKQWQADRARWQAARDFGEQVGPEPPLTPDAVSAAQKHLGRRHYAPTAIRDRDIEAVEAANDIAVGSHKPIRNGRSVVELEKVGSLPASRSAGYGQSSGYGLSGLVSEAAGSGPSGYQTRAGSQSYTGDGYDTAPAGMGQGYSSGRTGPASSSSYLDPVTSPHRGSPAASYGAGASYAAVDPSITAQHHRPGIPHAGRDSQAPDTESGPAAAPQWSTAAAQVSPRRGAEKRGYSGEAATSAAKINSAHRGGHSSQDRGHGRGRGGGGGR